MLVRNAQGTMLFLMGPTRLPAGRDSPHQVCLRFGGAESKRYKRHRGSWDHESLCRTQ